MYKTVLTFTRPPLSFHCLYKSVQHRHLLLFYSALGLSFGLVLAKFELEVHSTARVKKTDRLNAHAC